MKGLENCRIAQMLRKQKKHLSFHTPGHKRAGADITELSYSDNLASPRGVIAQAEEEIARILGAEKSYILTDGSTCGVHAMLYALKAAGASSVAYSAASHASVKNGCRILGLRGVEIPVCERAGIPLQPTEEEIERAVNAADALLLTSPDYYGNFPPLAFARAVCDKAKKPLVVDGAHGAHLHFTEYYAGKYADMWVDGMHKSLPALTQGAVVSARNAEWAEELREGVKLFRTTSPSYPVMASVEYAVKYPRNEKIERAAEEAKILLGAEKNADWSKILIAFGKDTDEAEAYLHTRGVYPEFNDGNYLMFYLSPCTTTGNLKKLARLVKKLPRGNIEETAPVSGKAGKETELVLLKNAIGRTCACDCGIFPPCVPLLSAGELVTEERAERLARAKNTFGLTEGKIAVYTEE